MAKNPLKGGNISSNSSGIDTATRRKVLGRAEELAILNRSWLHNVSPSDFEKARRELTGETDMAPREVTLESSPESERWDPVPGSKGHKTTVPSTSNDDEDEDGRSVNERLVEEGVAGAEHDQIIQAARAAAGTREV